MVINKTVALGLAPMWIVIGVLCYKEPILGFMAIVIGAFSTEEILR